MHNIKGKLNFKNKILYFCYAMILVNFIGVNFIKFKIAGINMNIGRILMMLSIIPLVVYIKKYGFKFIINKKNKTISIMLIFLMIWCIFSILTSIFSKDVYNTIINEFFMIFGTISILVLVNSLQSMKSIINVLKITEIATIINCIYAIILYYAKFPVYGGFYYNVNDLATFLVFGIPVEFGLLFINSKNKKIKLFRIFIIMLELYVFILLDSRACILGIIVGIIFMFFIGFYKRNKKIRGIVENKKIIFLLVLTIFISVSVLRLFCNKVHKAAK